MDLEDWRHSLQLSVDYFQTLLNMKDYGFKDQITHIGISVPIYVVKNRKHDSLKPCLQFLFNTKIPKENYVHKDTLE